MNGISYKKHDTNYSIAKKELEKKILPFIIKRPPDGNGNIDERFRIIDF